MLTPMHICTHLVAGTCAYMHWCRVPLQQPAQQPGQRHPTCCHALIMRRAEAPDETAAKRHEPHEDDHDDPCGSQLFVSPASVFAHWCLAVASHLYPSLCLTGSAGRTDDGVDGRIDFVVLDSHGRRRGVIPPCRCAPEHAPCTCSPRAQLSARRRQANPHSRAHRHAFDIIGRQSVNVLGISSGPRLSWAAWRPLAHPTARQARTACARATQASYCTP